jgi:DNA-binding NarL/FixJ family response regulator
MINVLLVEDSTVFAMGLQMALEGNPELTVLQHVTTSGAAVAFLNTHPEVNVAVVDITLEQQTDGLTLLGILREAFPGVAALVLSHYKIPAYIIQSITYGARGYLAKDSAPAEIAKAILAASAGDSIFFGETLPIREVTRIFGGKDNLQARRPQNLSPKELEVLQLVTSGYSNSQIAAALDVATTTIDSYKERIKGKFGFDSLVECVAHAVATDLVKAH